MELTHRPFLESDLPAVCAFPRDPQELYFMFPKAVYPLTQEQLRAAVAARAEATVVLAKGAVAGFANFYEWEMGGRCSMGNVIVSPAVRGRGVARYLVSRMAETAFTRYDAREVALCCFSTNTPALLLYTRMGFTPYAVEERVNWDGSRIAAVMMRLVRQG